MDLHLRSELLAQGWTDAELRRALRSGALTTVRPGSYAAGPAPEDDRPEDHHARLVRATLPHLRPGWTVSHVSAAVLLGLPVWNAPLDRVHVSRDGYGGGRTTTGVRRHVGPLAPDEVVAVGGIAVTEPARTVLDVAATAGFEQAVVVADAALAPRSGRRPPLTDRGRLHEALARRGRSGRAAAARVVAFADGGAHSPGESRSRVALWRAGLPRPVLQHPVLGPDGRTLGFADFGWPELRTVGEFDGRVKYGRLVAAGQVPADVLHAEKLREDAMRATGLGVVRWGWADVDRFIPVARRLTSTFRPRPGRAGGRTWPDLRS